MHSRTKHKKQHTQRTLRTSHYTQHAATGGGFFTGRRTYNGRGTHSSGGVGEVSFTICSFRKTPPETHRATETLFFRDAQKQNALHLMTPSSKLNETAQRRFSPSRLSFRLAASVAKMCQMIPDSQKLRCEIEIDVNTIYLLNLRDDGNGMAIIL